MPLLLTIAIPTYNRNEKAKRQVSDVLAQLPAESVELLVVDNASDTPIQKTLSKEGILDDDRLRIITNPANVGLAANLNRCFEHAKGEWVWLLGDDDKIHADAVQRILIAISTSHPNCLLHKFSGTIQAETHCDEEVKSLKRTCDLASDAWFFSNLLFISSSVYKREIYIQNLSGAYHWNITVAPHLVVLIQAMKKGSRMQLHSANIVECIPATGNDHWNLTRLRMGLQTLLEIEECENEVHRVLNKLMRQWYGGWYSPMISLLLCLRSTRPRVFWKAWHLRNAASTSGLHSLIQIGIAVLWTPIGCSNFTRSLVHHWKGKRDDQCGLSRM